jgi:hypothetical protein
MIAMAMLSQQLADFNGGWEPDWEEEYYNWCIRSEFNGSELVFVATLKLHTYLPDPISFNSGSPPRLPTIITLLIPAILFLLS